MAARKTKRRSRKKAARSAELDKQAARLREVLALMSHTAVSSALGGDTEALTDARYDASPASLPPRASSRA